MGNRRLGTFELLVMLAILQQDKGNGAYAAGVIKELGDREGEVSRGALYRSLDRMQDKGYIRWELEDAADHEERGGHPLRRFWVTEVGLAAIQRSRDTLIDLWTGLEHRLERR